MKTQMPPLNREPITILLVEDEPAHAEIVRRNLDVFPSSHRLVHVEDGQMALDYLFGAAPGGLPDLILLDLRLPKVDGLEVLRQIQASGTLKNIPTVVLTTSAADADLAAAFRLGAVSYQLKPVTFEGYTELLKSAPQPESLRRPPSHE